MLKYYNQIKLVSKWLDITVVLTFFAHLGFCIFTDMPLLAIANLFPTEFIVILIMLSIAFDVMKSKCTMKANNLNR